jgi:hypothetical protein
MILSLVSKYGFLDFTEQKIQGSKLDIEVSENLQTCSFMVCIVYMHFCFSFFANFKFVFLQYGRRS